MDTFVYDPSYSILDFDPTPNNMLQGEDFCSGFVDDFRTWNHQNQEMMMHCFEYNMEMEANNQQQQLLLCDGGSSSTTTQGVMMSSAEEVQEEGKKTRRPIREVKNKGNSSSNSSCSSTLSRQTISKYFYMPITQAARHLNIGLTLLKKRCRELGIRRWPHRKLMSLQTLIKNVQEMKNGVGGQMVEKKLRETIDILEAEKKLMEEIPDMELEGQTQRLRQACFRAKYKKRKLVGIMDSHHHHLQPSSFKFNYKVEDSAVAAITNPEEDFDSIFADCLSSPLSINFNSTLTPL